MTARPIIAFLRFSGTRNDGQVYEAITIATASRGHGILIVQTRGATLSWHNLLQHHVTGSLPYAKDLGDRLKYH